MVGSKVVLAYNILSNYMLIDYCISVYFSDIMAHKRPAPVKIEELDNQYPMPVFMGCSHVFPLLKKAALALILMVLLLTTTLRHEWWDLVLVKRKVSSDLIKKKMPVKIEDCEIKHARRGPKMKVMLKGATKIT